MEEKIEQVDYGLIEILRNYEEKRETLIRSIDLIRSNARFILTASAVIFSVFAALAGVSNPLSVIQQVAIIGSAVIALVLYIAIVFMLIKPLQMFDWVPGISGNREKLLGYYYGKTEAEVINRRITVIVEEIDLNREKINDAANSVNRAQVLFSISVIILLLMFIVSRL